MKKNDRPSFAKKAENPNEAKICFHLLFDVVVVDQAEVKNEIVPEHAKPSKLKPKPISLIAEITENIYFAQQVINQDPEKYLHSSFFLP